MQVAIITANECALHKLIQVLQVYHTPQCRHQTINHHTVTFTDGTQQEDDV